MSRRYELRILDLISNYLEVGRKVKEIVKKFDPHAKVYIFGSVVKGRYTGASDIDILIITNRKDLKYRMMVEVYRYIEAPVELHIVTNEEFREWYYRFIGSDELVEV